jgi:hypothetical protein
MILAHTLGAPGSSPAQSEKRKKARTPQRDTGQWQGKCKPTAAARFQGLGGGGYNCQNSDNMGKLVVVGYRGCCSTLRRLGVSVGTQLGVQLGWLALVFTARTAADVSAGAQPNVKASGICSSPMARTNLAIPSVLLVPKVSSPVLYRAGRPHSIALVFDQINP